VGHLDPLFIGMMNQAIPITILEQAIKTRVAQLGYGRVIKRFIGVSG